MAEAFLMERLSFFLPSPVDDFQ